MKGWSTLLSISKMEMVLQHSLVYKTLTEQGSKNVILASDIQEWARIFSESNFLTKSKKLCWEYCRRISISPERNLKTLLRSNSNAPANVTHSNYIYNHLLLDLFNKSVASLSFIFPAVRNNLIKSIASLITSKKLFPAIILP